MGNKVKKVYIGDKQVRPVIPPYLCFTSEQANSTVKLNKIGSPTSVTLETSTDGESWSTYTFGTDITLSNVGDKVYWRNTSDFVTGFSIDHSNYYNFVMSGSISASGDVNFLLSKNSSNSVNNYCFDYLFMGCSALTTAPELPATTLGEYCYHQMFRNCTGLTVAPKLPAMTMARNCYNYMFWGSGLTTAPELPATTLANYCYSGMFWGCSSLTTAPELPATTLAESCYYGMYRLCDNLTSLPKLPATTLVNYGYATMFLGCTKIKLSTTKTGEYQTPYRIPVTGTGTTASGAQHVGMMFDSTGGTFTGTPSINTTYYTSNTVV